MTEAIIKVCKVHGELTKEQCFFHSPYINGKRYIQCKACRKGYADKHATKICGSPVKKERQSRYIKSQQEKARSTRFIDKHKILSGHELISLFRADLDLLLKLLYKPHTNLSPLIACLLELKEKDYFNLLSKVPNEFDNPG